MGLELCTGDGCENSRPAKELVPPKTLFLSFLISEALTGLTSKLLVEDIKTLFRNNFDCVYVLDGS